MASRTDRPDKKKPQTTAVQVVNRPVPAVVDPSSEAPQTDVEARKRGMLAVHQMNLVWLQLRGTWKWLAVIPAEPELSTADFAHALSQVGSRLSSEAIDFVEASNVDLDSASWLIARLGTSAGSSESWRPDPASTAPDWTRPPGKTLVALDNPISNPLALPVALAADGVIVCVRRGRTPLSLIRSTIEAVGADHILCSVLID
jgi:hypothetical protein